MNNTELEIKCLLSTQENADAFILKLQQHWVDTNTMIKAERQLNHYFSWGNILDIYNKLSSHIPMKDAEKLYNICVYGRNHSVRTRSILPWDHTILVVKSSNNDDTSTHSISRLEREHHFTMMNLEELDAVLLDLGWEYLSKRSRIRTNYRIENIDICLDHNAGYGYVVEFETVLVPGEDITAAELRIRSLMETLWVKELPQAKLELMFSHYNTHWRDYYGSNRTFDMWPDGSMIHYGFDTWE